MPMGMAPLVEVEGFAVVGPGPAAPIVLSLQPLSASR